jgi:Fuc2NAc and GlcNAc transferase
MCGLALTVLLSTWLITAVTLKLALARQVLDIPNQRSSHLAPTPKAGGIGMVMAASAALYWLAAGWGAQMWLPLTALATCGIAIATIGLADDLKPLSARLRLGVQLLAATILLAGLQDVPRFTAAGFSLPFYLGLPLALLWLLWMTNLYNFMDGIDGLAGMHAMAVGFCAALLLAAAQVPAVLWLAPLLVAVASGGFMVWNFPPARIFMGDTGSAWLGFVFAALALLSGIYDPGLFWLWAILLAVFVTDATLTLLTRLLRGQRIHEAHRCHAYQRVSLRLMEHYKSMGDNPATARSRAHRLYGFFVLAVVLAWLLPLAWLAAGDVVDGFVATLIAYGPLVVAALWLGAGRDH